jgi:hypothetical protein
MPADPIVSIWGIDYAEAFATFSIQPHLQEQIVGWLERGSTPSQFLQDVICNNLRSVFMADDRRDQAAVWGVVHFFEKYGPENCASFRHDGNALFNWPRRVKAKIWTSERAGKGT